MYALIVFSPLIFLIFWINVQVLARTVDPSEEKKSFTPCFMISKVPLIWKCNQHCYFWNDLILRFISRDINTSIYVVHWQWRNQWKHINKIIVSNKTLFNDAILLQCFMHLVFVESSWPMISMIARSFPSDTKQKMKCHLWNLCDISHSN